jgi:hypothetical protein
MAPRSPDDVPGFVSDALDGLADLRSDSAALQNILAGVAAASGLAQPSRGARERLLTGATGGVMRYAPFFFKLGQLFELQRSAVMQACLRSLDDAEWQPGPHPSVRLMHLEGGPHTAGADVGLVSMPSDLPWPLHRHLGEERVLLLEGSYVDHTGRLYQPGDLHDMAAGSEHSFFVQPGQRLVLAVVLFGGFEFVTP